MAIVGSVLDEETVVANTLTSFTLTFPQSGLNVVAVFHNCTYISIPLDASRNAILPSAGSGQATYPARISGVIRRVNFVINGTALNYSVYTGSTTSDAVFYYGTPLTGGIDLKMFAGVAAAVTLSSGAGTGTITFPSGPLTMTGVTVAMGGAAASLALNVSWSTSSGQTFNIYISSRILTNSNGDNSDIIPLALTVAQTVAFTVSKGVGSDLIVLFAYYQYQ